VIDDFGAGYSNLKRIVDLEPQIVKLDLAFTRDLDRLPRQRMLVEHVVNLCVQLGAQVVAEGIETIDELKATIDCGVHYGQGYLLARPGFPVPEVRWPLG
jgi:EAL domain-containing protein (putative c-di-GMP-specific phosphodiesterase class I)